MSTGCFDEDRRHRYMIVFIFTFNSHHCRIFCFVAIAGTVKIILVGLMTGTKHKIYRWHSAGPSKQSLYHLVSTIFLFLLPLKEVGYVFTSVCLSLCQLDYSKSYDWVLMNFLEGQGPRKSLLDFGSNPGHDPEPGTVDRDPPLF